mmetsp:Transcript_13705/g.24057  ORF Transcript_13705/g.24057 Transcript_13705/m.24057 type:complete len:286 (-) Transcript_13705:469-1326(-)
MLTFLLVSRVGPRVRVAGLALEVLVLVVLVRVDRRVHAALVLLAARATVTAAPEGTAPRALAGQQGHRVHWGNSVLLELTVPAHLAAVWLRGHRLGAGSSLHGSVVSDQVLRRGLHLLRHGRLSRRQLRLLHRELLATLPLRVARAVCGREQPRRHVLWSGVLCEDLRLAQRGLHWRSLHILHNRVERCAQQRTLDIDLGDLQGRAGTRIDGGLLCRARHGVLVGGGSRRELLSLRINSTGRGLKESRLRFLIYFMSISQGLALLPPDILLVLNNTFCGMPSLSV